MAEPATTTFEEALKAKFQDIFSSAGEQDEKLTRLLQTAKESMDAELNAIRINREDIKKEKTELHGKYKALQEQFNTLEAENKSLNEKLKSNAPEEIQKVYDQKLNENSVFYEKQLNELKAERDNYKQKSEEAEKSQLRLECMQEFNNAIKGKNIASDCIQDFSEFVLGEGCSKFSRKSLGDGQTVLANKDGLTIQQAVDRAKDTTFGKRCMVLNSTGGGAEGGAGGAANPKENPFLTGNYTKQAELFRTDRALYERLKAAAKK